MGNLRQYLANRLASLRATKGWNQHDLAAACSEIAGEKRSASWVRGYEQKTRWPKPEELELLGRALGVDPASLIAAPREPTPAEALGVLAQAIERPAISGAPADLAPRLATAGAAEWAAIRVALEGQAIGKEQTRRPIEPSSASSPFFRLSGGPRLLSKVRVAMSGFSLFRALYLSCLTIPPRKNPCESY